ncbi:MAG: SDR family NAD(P)-dependent oxidoreductase [Alistipes sp.]|nr:SDR family NAD(P)-dependent oxidoreductase [Alistipes sp.]
MDNKRIVIVGATSGIGLETARRFAAAGWTVGIAGRRTEELERLCAEAPQSFTAERIDITAEDAVPALHRLIERIGGMDVYLHVAGVGFQNPRLDASVEMHTAQTNVAGFVRMISAAYRYFASHGGGRIAAVSSIAGTRGLGAAAAYSASKRFQNTYLDSLAQLARMERLDIRFTDIRPGFVATALLDDGKRYPMLMRPERVAGRICNAVLRGRRTVVIDFRYSVLVFFWRLIPRFLWERLPIRNA